MKFVIIHGIGGHPGIHWQAWLKNQLEAAGHDVVALKLPAAAHPDRLSWLSTLKRAVMDVPPSQLILVGHSLGTTTGLDFIEQSTNPVFGFVSVSGFANDYGAELNAYFLRVKQIDFSKIRSNVLHAAVLFSDNDPYVTPHALLQVSHELRVTPHDVKDGGHLNADSGFTEFPLLLNVINTEILT